MSSSAFARTTVLPALLLASAPAFAQDHIDRSGTSELVFWQTINGTVVGSLLGYVLFAEQIRAHCLPAMPGGARPAGCARVTARATGVGVLGMAAGISAPLLLTRGKPLPTSTAILVNRATVIGAMHGYIIPFAAGLTPFDTDSPEYVVEMTESRWLAGLTLAGDLAGVGAGVLLSRRDPLPVGTLSFIGSLHLSVFWAGMTVGASLPEDVDQDDLRLITATSLGLADAALAIALAYADRIDIGRNRVFWLDTGALLGAVAGSAVGAIIGGDRSRAIGISSALGMGVGMVLAYWGTQNTEPWRRRYQPAPGVNVELDAPALRLEPHAGEDGGGAGLAVSLDLLKGTF